MELSNFEMHTDPIIVDRGFDYFMRDAVKQISRSNHTFRMRVSGTKTYKVEIELNERQEIIYSTCDCPYEKGEICKHEVAGFFALRELLQDEKPTRSTDLAAAKKEIREAIRSHSDWTGFISYYQMNALVRDLELVLRKVEELSNPLTSLDIALHFLEQTVRVITMGDDSSGYLGSLIQETLNFIEHLVKGYDFDEATRKKVFAKVLTASDAKVFDDWEENRLYLYQICLHFADMDLVRKKLLAKIEEQINTGESDYYLDELLKLKIGLLPQNERLEFLYDQRQHQSMRTMLLDRHLQKKNYEAVLDLALEGEEQDQRLPGLVYQWKKKRLEAYRGLGMQEEERALAEELLLGGDMSYYEAVRTFLDYETLIAKVENERLYVEIIEKERDFPRMLAYVQNNPAQIRVHDKKLFKEYPEEVQEIYEAYIKMKASYAIDRRGYREVCRIIKGYAKYGSADQVAAIIQELKEAYQRKPAFLDELGKL